MAGHHKRAVAPTADSGWGFPRGHPESGQRTCPPGPQGQLHPTVLPPEGHAQSCGIICVARGGRGVKQVTCLDGCHQKQSSKKHSLHIGGSEPQPSTHHPGCTPGPRPWPAGTLTRRGARGEAGGDLGQRVPAARAAGQGLLGLPLLLQARALPDFLSDGRVQQAAGGDGAMPEYSVAGGVQGEKQGLRGDRHRPVTPRAPWGPEERDIAVAGRTPPPTAAR